MKVVIAIGTRPEAIKMAPVYWALAETGSLDVDLLLTGQHREQLQQALEAFEISGETNLDLMHYRQSMGGLASRLLPAITEHLQETQPDYVLVHGDTLTTFCTAWAAFLEQIPVGHVEAGLRSGRLDEPFPEEANRRLTDVLTDLCLAPTDDARKNLLQEGRSDDDIVVTGQTGVDAILEMTEIGELPPQIPDGPLVTVTLHRREKWPKLPAIANGLAQIARRFPALSWVFPVHLNPAVREAVEPALLPVANFHLIEPLEYSEMAALLNASELIVTDSGGIQEEGAVLGVPVVVVRDVTERPEGVGAGCLRLAGTDPAEITANVLVLLNNEKIRDHMADAPNPFGDGNAAKRVAAAVAWRLGLGERPENWQPTEETES